MKSGGLTYTLNLNDGYPFDKFASVGRIGAVSVTRLLIGYLPYIQVIGINLVKSGPVGSPPLLKL
jgi:hypothetical protein